VLQVQRGEVEDTYGTGATVWPAAVALCKYLEKKKSELVKNKRVVDLGAGTAITSIAAALLGALSVLCTDGQASVVQLARDNVQRVASTLGGKTSSDDDDAGELLEIAGCPITVQEYWWGSGTITAEQGQPPCDVVLVSDCVLPKLYPIAPLVDALDELLVLEGAVAILSYEHRYFQDYDPRDKFRELAAAKQLQVDVVPLTEQDEVYSVEDIEIWQVTRMVQGGSS
jgi:predicted nicotinamide N-methyase